MFEKNHNLQWEYTSFSWRVVRPKSDNDATDDADINLYIQNEFRPELHLDILGSHGWEAYGYSERLFYSDDNRDIFLKTVVLRRNSRHREFKSGKDVTRAEQDYIAERIDEEREWLKNPQERDI